MKKTDIVIVGSGCSGLYCALGLPKDKQILIVTKSQAENSDSFLAQGGMCMLKNEEDYDSYFEDTMRAGHYENDRTSVEIMIRSSQDVVADLIRYGVRFKKDDQGNLMFTREGAHSQKRILFHEDVTGKEITSHLLERVRALTNVTIMENTTMLDILSEDNVCKGIIVEREDHELEKIRAQVTVLATGGIGGLFAHSTNFSHLTGDALAVALCHNVELENINYIQIHPTTLYAKESRSFLISESVRGEGAKLYDKHMQRFVDELLPRDLLTEAIKKQMEIDGTDYVWEDLRTIPEKELKEHFPNIVNHCLEMGYDVTKECIPVVPAQHYFMGGIKVNYNSRTSMEQLYAVGETACNGVHGKNRLASNSLLESLVFAKRAAKAIAVDLTKEKRTADNTKSSENDMLNILSLRDYKDVEMLEKSYQNLVREEIARADREKEIG